MLASNNNNITMTDVNVGENMGYNFIISDKLLGHGSYGDVYLATNENGKKIAIKCCDIDEFDIPNILETSIMSSFLHPYLNRAFRIHASDTKLYILQELAKIDLAHHTRRDKNDY